MTEKPTIYKTSDPEARIIGTNEKSKSKLPKDRKYYIYSGLIIILVITGLLIAGFHQTKPKQTSGTTIATNVTIPNVCTTQILTLAGQNLYPRQITQLAKITTQIKTLNNYQHDPNCLYPMIVYSINFNDPKDAQKYLDIYKQVLKPNQTLSGALGINIKSSDDFQSEITFLNTQAKQLNQFTDSNNTTKQ